MVSFLVRTSRWFLAPTLLGLCACALPAAAQTTFTASDSAFSFRYPQRWQVTEKDDKILLTASDGSRYTLQRDTLTTLPTGSPSNDPDLKETAAKLMAPILKNATFARVSSVTMDHGQGASFRFKATRNGEDTNADVWIGVIGKHSVVLLPEKAGQASQSISLAVVFQSMVFTDALPKLPPPRPRPADTNTTSQTTNASTSGGVSTVSFQQQIAPI